MNEVSVSAKRKHCQSAMLKMWDLRLNNQLTDVAIKVGEIVFHCHRIILSASSQYFRSMFRECSATEIALHPRGLDANTFEMILRFIYTGSFVMNESNVLAIISAAAYFRLPLLERHFIIFARQPPRPMSREDIIELFYYALAAGMRVFAKCLGERIYGDFGFFSDSPQFIRLKWKSLIELSSLGPNDDKQVLTDTFVEGILKWIRSQPPAATADGRSSYFEQLVKVVRDRQSFTNGIQHILDRYENAEQAPPGTSAVAVLGERPAKLLRAFAKKSATPHGVKVASVFTLHETNAGLAWAYSGESKSAEIFMKSIEIDDSLFTMAIPSSFDEARTMFSHRRRRADPGAAHQVLMHERDDYLKRPPVLLSNFDMCGWDKNIFVYDKTDLPVYRQHHFSGSADLNFTEEQLHRGVFHYRRDVDQWFSVVSPLEKYIMSCMTCEQSVVYLIGGTNSNGAVQAYDLRTPKWMNLPSTTGIYEDAACCVRDGRVWVVGGVGNPDPTAVEIFDPISGTWECGKDLIEIRPGGSRLVNWNSVHYGPTVVSFRDSWYANEGILFADDNQPTGWNTIPDLNLELSYKSGLGVRQCKYDCIVDMVAF